MVRIKVGAARGQDLYVLLDKEDSIRLGNRSLRLDRYGYAYFRTRSGSKRPQTYIHRFVMDTPAHLTVDHINHDKMDNRKSNLRNVTIQENLKNKRSKVIKL